jgi:5'-nucleotidase
MMPPGLVSNLQEALQNRKGTVPKQQEPEDSNDTVSTTDDNNPIEFDESKPIILLTNSDGVESPGLTHLVEALVLQGLYNVHVCVPQSCVLF